MSLLLGADIIAVNSQIMQKSPKFLMNTAFVLKYFSIMSL